MDLPGMWEYADFEGGEADAAADRDALNARASQAYHDLIAKYESENTDHQWPGFDDDPHAFEEGWETGYKAKRSEMSREVLEDAVREALDDLGIIGYPTSARNDAEEPLDAECVVGHVAGFIAAIVRSETPS